MTKQKTTSEIAADSCWRTVLRYGDDPLIPTSAKALCSYPRCSKSSFCKQAQDHFGQMVIRRLCWRLYYRLRFPGWRYPEWW